MDVEFFYSSMALKVDSFLFLKTLLHLFMSILYFLFLKTLLHSCQHECSHDIQVAMGCAPTKGMITHRSADLVVKTIVVHGRTSLATTFTLVVCLNPKSKPKQVVLTSSQKVPSIPVGVILLSFINPCKFPRVKQKPISARLQQLPKGIGKIHTKKNLAVHTMIGPTITLVVLAPVLVLCQFVVGTFKYACTVVVFLPLIFTCSNELFLLLLLLIIFVVLFFYLIK